MSEIGLLSPNALNTAVSTLARAFANDPMFSWLVPGVQRRADALRHFNRLPLEYGLRYGRVTASHDGGAVAVWVPPGVAITSIGMIRTGLLGLPVRVGLRVFAKFMGATVALDRIHRARVPDPHWYLFVVAVHPDLQGKGFGTKLVAEGLAHVDLGRSPCYLETSNPRNVPLYERLGFTVLAEVSLGSDGPPAWAMRRGAVEPR